MALDYLPLFFDLRGREVLLVGGGEIALRKARLLTSAGARVVAVADEFAADLVGLLEAHGGRLVSGGYAPAMLEGKALVVVASEDSALQRLVHADALARILPINVVDAPTLCTFIFPSIVDRSPLVVAIGSGGQAPVLARMLRARLETEIPAAYGRLASLVGHWRDRVKARFTDPRKRRAFWDRALSGAVAERVLAGQDAAAEALLGEQLAAPDPMRGVGEVFLIGAGPGDPELLTFKALRLMQQADVVLYDRLVSDAVLSLCRRDAQLVYVGKRRDDHAVPQQDINELLVSYARAGQRVVRLKGGDPFIFGRGGEELERLKAAGVPFQVVPGITAASACSAYAGIPLTHRRFAQSVRFVTGQLKNRTSDLDFASLVSPDETIVFYMGLHTLEALVDGLTAHGKPRETPIAIVSQGTSEKQRVLTGTLADIVARQAVAQLAAPAIVIVGEVVALQEQLAWFGSGGTSPEA